MELKRQNILFFTRNMGLGGTENVILQLCEVFNPVVNKIIVCSSGGMNVDKLEKMGVKHYCIPDIEKKRPEIMISVMRSLREIVQTEEITLIHTHHRMAAFYVSLLQLYKKCFFINTCHNTFGNKKTLTRFSYGHAKLVACGEKVKKNLVNFYDIPEEKVTVIYNAVKPFEGEIKEEPFFAKLHEKGLFVVGNVGRLSEQKGMEYFIQAIPLVIKERQDVRFVIVGSGEDEVKLKSMASDLAINEQLVFWGYCDDVQNLMCQMDLVVLSSLWEGLPLTPIEAYSVGKSVVATAVDGTVEIVEDMKDGILVECKSPEALAQKILWMINNPLERKRMEDVAFRKYNNEFSFDILAQAYIGLYKKIIEG